MALGTGLAESKSLISSHDTAVFAAAPDIVIIEII